METYDSYKDSGVEWIGDIPSGWDKSKVKYHFHLISGFPFSSEDITKEEREYPIIRIGNVTSGNTDVYFEGELSNKHPLVNYGDYVVSLTGDFSIRKWENKPSLLNQRCGLIKKITSDNERFLFYYLPFQFRILEKTKYFTTLKNLSNVEFLDIEFIPPPISEQQQIVSFLDSKTLFIDSLIEKTQQKIELLKEKRTSLINELVTKGLNPNVEMKDSGVEWIGEIPDGWRIVPLRYLGSFQNGISKGSEFFGTGYPFMSYGDVYKNDITPTKLNGKVQLEDSEIDRYTIQRGDVFFTRTSETKDDIGVCSTCLNTIENSGFSGFVIRFRFHNNVHLPEYSRYHFQTHWKKVIIESKMNIVTRSSLSQQVLGDTPVLIPDRNEQQQIVDYLDEQTQLIDNTRFIEEKRIELLKEYRQSLISEVVTGKRKVV